MPSHSGAALSDSQLIQIVDTALSSTARKSAAWLVCRPGCFQCCVGVFAINSLDALRLRTGLSELDMRDPDRALRLRQRVTQSSTRLSTDFPGNLATGLMHEGAENSEDFDSFANDEVCPVLDPETGTCDLYAARPMTCRVFGPPVRSEDGLGVCELCYHGASPEEIADCEMVPDPNDLEARLVADLERSTGQHGTTIVALALRGL